MKEEQINKIETEKIVVEKHDELIDILNKVEDSKASKVILTFTEPTDLLISPINLKVILDVADDSKKILVAQIIQNPSGVRNAKDAGMVVTEATGTILDDYWMDAEKTFKARMKFKEDKLFSKKGNNRKEAKQMKSEDIEEKVENEGQIVETLEPKAKSEFENFVDQVLQKSQDGINNKKPAGRRVEEGGVVLALDGDIDEPEGEGVNAFPVPNFQSLIGKDMGAFKHAPADEEEAGTKKDAKEESPKKKKKMNGFVNPLPAFFASFKNIGKSKNVGMTLLKIFVPIILLLGVVAFLIYQLAPLVRVTVFVQSKSIALEKDFTGTVGTEEFSYDDGLIPVKREEIKKDSSGNTTPTGVAFRGNKAEGIVQLTYWKWQTNGHASTTIPAGTSVTSTGGLVFVTITSLTLGDGDATTITKDVGVRASNLGTEYNLSGGQEFTVAGYPGSDMTGTNSAAFSGGSKEQYTVLSKNDVDKVVETLKKDVFADSLGELQAKTDGGWELITTTLKQELVGDPKTDVAIGGEASIVNITFTTKSSALYYQRSNIDEQIATVLSKAAQEQNLFNNNSGLALSLSDDIQKDIKVTSAKNDTVKIKLTASGTIKPQVNKEEILNDLQGKNWTDGLASLKKYSYSDQETKVEFSPSYFPEFLKYFPSLQGRIILVIQDI